LKKVTYFSIILMLAISVNAVAQSSAAKKNPMGAIAEISNMNISSKWQEGLVYKIQILASKDPLKNVEAQLNNLGNVYSYEHNGLTKYTWGRTRLPHEAARLQGEMHRNGFKDAFVVHYYNGKRISAEEAKALREKNK
jgi:hypothetical protein